MEVIVKITDKSLGVKANEVYIAEPYSLDPASKVTLLRRVPDGYTPLCNLYWREVAVHEKYNAK